MRKYPHHNRFTKRYCGKSKIKQEAMRRRGYFKLPRRDAFDIIQHPIDETPNGVSVLHETGSHGSIDEARV